MSITFNTNVTKATTRPFGDYKPQKSIKFDLAFQLTNPKWISGIGIMFRYKYKNHIHIHEYTWSKPRKFTFTHTKGLICH